MKTNIYKIIKTSIIAFLNEDEIINLDNKEEIEIKLADSNCRKTTIIAEYETESVAVRRFEKEKENIEKIKIDNKEKYIKAEIITLEKYDDFIFPEEIDYYINF